MTPYDCQFLRDRLRGKAYLTNTIKGPIPQEELDKHNKKKSKKKEEDQ